MNSELTDDELAELAPPATSEKILSQAGFDGIKSGDIAAIENALRTVGDLAKALDEIGVAGLRESLIRRLGALEIQSPARMADTVVREVSRSPSAAASQGSSLSFPVVTPWETPVDMAVVLDEIRKALNRFLVLPLHADVALTLWAAHTWVYELFDFTLYVLIHSPAPECGKSRVLDVLSPIVRRPAKGSSFSAPVLFRAVEKYKPTLLIDEGDAFLDSEELRGVMNDGYSRSSRIFRCEGDNNEVSGFSAYCPKAIAKIGKLTGKWSTVASRSVMIPMRRKLRKEHIERLRFRQWESEAEPLRRKLARFAADHARTLTASEPPLPDELGDRQRESWLPLLAIADAAGGDWPKLARTAAVALCAAGFRTEDSTLSEALLQDIRGIFATRAEARTPDADRIFSKDLCEELIKIESRPWAEFGQKEKPITPTQLSRLLKGYGIESRQQKIAEVNRNGYAKADFTEAWERYLDNQDIHTQPDPPDPKVYRVYPTDSNEVKTCSETLPQQAGRVSNEALKPNEINAVDPVESRSPGNGHSARGISHPPEPCLPSSGEVQSKPTDDWLQRARQGIARIRARKQQAILEEGVI